MAASMGVPVEVRSADEAWVDPKGKSRQAEPGGRRFMLNRKGLAEGGSCGGGDKQEADGMEYTDEEIAGLDEEEMSEALRPFGRTLKKHNQEAISLKE